MKRAFKIYFSDMKRVFTNWAALAIILGLIVLPSLYAWFNIKASWDPYGNTRGIKIAVTNQDDGAVVKGKKINVGEEVIKALKQNKKLGWTFVDEKTALDGVKHGNYYASILVPKNFSKRIASVLTEQPVKAQIDYTVNEKVNAIAPKITEKGATVITDQISRAFVKTTTGVIFKIFNELGVELESELPTIEKVRDLIFLLQKNFPEFRKAVNTAMQDADTAESLVKTALKNLPLVKGITQNGIKASDAMQGYLKRGKEAVDTVAPNIKQGLEIVDQTSLFVESVTGAVLDGAMDNSTAKAKLRETAGQLKTSISALNGIRDIFTHIEQLAGNQGLSPEIAKLNQLKDQFQNELTLTSQVLSTPDVSSDTAKKQLQTINRSAAETHTTLSDLLNRYDSDLQPKLIAGYQKAQQTLQTANQLLTQANQQIPEVEKILADAGKGLAIGQKDLGIVKSDLPAAEAKINDLANKIRKFEAENNLQDIIRLLKLNYQKEGAFFAEPVVLKEHRLYPIPNYGSGMSPFFTTLSLWVGALLLVSLLTVEVYQGEAFRSYHIYFGRFFTFWTFALMQSLIVTSGDMLVLGTFVVDKGWFIGFGLIISSVFMCIVYTLVSVFGNVGKALSIILLVLQLAGSGGTFPIQVTPPFFQAIYPFLPFTYAISMMREAVGGMLVDIVEKDVMMLGIFVIITLILGLLLKRPINRVSRRLVEKAKSSHLIH